MQLHGLSKLTLLDFPGHLACTAFTGTCNFRCPYCHNAPLVLAPGSCPVITEEEFFEFLASRKGKLDGVCITGGEPTLQPDLSEFISKIKAMGLLVKLDTNGYQPEVLKKLLDAQLLDMVAMDIKNSRDFYASTAGVHEASFELERIEKSISLLLQSGIRHEFRTTVTKELHSTEKMQHIGAWLSGLGGKIFHTSTLPSVYYIQNFKDSGNLVCGDTSRFHPVEDEVLQEFISVLQPYIPNTKLRGQG
ncbi:MAG: anaerobic ribonucleoside-triphosphate reductase activating protein [Lachnospiraceae bacterium]|nr:anaerobic ribonucleoside-triphosphate reductase activating protein [Lachnospiraceae bacterium]